MYSLQILDRNFFLEVLKYFENLKNVKKSIFYKEILSVRNKKKTPGSKIWIFKGQSRI